MSRTVLYVSNTYGSALTAIFQVNLISSPFWIPLELRVMKEVVTTETRYAKLQSNRHHQQTNTQFLQVGCPSCRPTNSVKAMKETHMKNESGTSITTATAYATGNSNHMSQQAVREAATLCPRPLQVDLTF